MVSDEEYDSLFSELLSLEEANPEYKSASSPTNQVGAQVEKPSHGLVKHKRPMLSLSNTYSKEDLESFESRNMKLLKNKEVTMDTTDPNVNPIVPILLHVSD